MIRVAALALALARGTTAAHADEVRATGAGYVGGAIVCQTGAMIDVAMDWIRHDAMLRLIGPEARRNYEAMYGRSRVDLEAIGCALVPPGTRLRVVEQVGPLYHVEGGGYDGYTTGMGLERAN